MTRVQIVDSHTGGEPTRVVISGGPDLGGGTVADRLAVLREQHDRFRAAVVNEPRGSDVLVGALLVEPSDKLRSEEHTSELQSRGHLVCRLLLEKKKLRQGPSVNA